MTQEEIKDVIAKLKADTDEQKGYFGIFQYGSGSDESFIKANKEGLKLFAAEILEAVAQVDNALTNAARRTIPFSHDNAWTDENSDTSIHYIEPVEDAARKSEYAVEPETLKDTAIKYGCIAVAIFLLVSMLIGIVTVVKWIF